MIRGIIKIVCRPLLLKMTVSEPEATREHKMSDIVKKSLYPVLWFTFAGTTGYWVLKDEKWLPWYAGGSGEFSDGFENMPFTPMKPSVHTWALILAGYPLQLTFT